MRRPAAARVHHVLHAVGCAIGVALVGLQSASCSRVDCFDYTTTTTALGCDPADPICGKNGACVPFSPDYTSSYVCKVACPHGDVDCGECAVCDTRSDPPTCEPISETN